MFAAWNRTVTICISRETCGALTQVNIILAQMSKIQMANKIVTFICDKLLLNIKCNMKCISKLKIRNYKNH